MMQAGNAPSGKPQLASDVKAVRGHRFTKTDSKEERTMSESREGLNYNEMKDELQALRKKLEDLEANQSALQVGTRPTARRRFSRRLITASISLAALLVAAGGLLWGQQIQALFVDNQGNVGIGVNPPGAKLDVAGKIKAAEADVSGLLKGRTLLAESAQVTTGTLDVTNKAIAGTLESRGDLKAKTLVVDESATLGNAIVKNNLNPGGELLTVGGDVTMKGKLTSKGRFQRDDEPEATYDILPRYTLVLTAPNYAMKSKTIPLDVLGSVCGYPEGCQAILVMYRWSNFNQSQGWGKSFRFFYSSADRKWSVDRSVKGDDEGLNNTDRKDIFNLENTCILSNHTWKGGKDVGNEKTGMQMVLWNNGGNHNEAQRSCTLTLIK
jgi:hypothetical protein